MIALLTDFGIEDSYVATMKAVIYSINPDAKIVDITHFVKQQNIKEAAFHLQVSYKFFPQGTIFVCVVDPGVGSDREPILLKTDEYLFLAPNNGLLTQIVNDISNGIIFDLTADFKNFNNISNTFHGRDIFAPAAANLSQDSNFYFNANILNPLKIVLLNPPLLNIINKNIFQTEIQHIDNFGNIITSVSSEHLTNNQFHSLSIKYKDKKIQCFFSKCYSDVEEGEFISYIGSSKFLEIGIRNGNAADRIGIKTNELIVVEINKK